jgi:hypothetical protein
MDGPVPSTSPFDLEAVYLRHHRLVRWIVRAAGIPEAQREAFVHIELGGLTAPEAAAVLGAKIATVTSRLRLARRRVGAALGLDARAMARDAAPSDTAQTRRAWGVIAARIAVEPVIPAAAAVGGGGWLAGGAVGAAIGAALVGVFVMTRPPDGTRPPRFQGAPADTAVDPVMVVDDPRPPAVAIDHDPPPADVRAVAPASPPAPARPRRPIPTRAVAPRVDPTRAPTADSPVPADALAAEAKLLRRAAQEIDAGRDDLAARTLQDHAQRFPSGQLVDERERLRALLGPPRGGPPLVSAG